MIISFNPDIFKIKDEHSLDLISKIFTLILEDKHLIDTRSISMLFNSKGIESVGLAATMSLRQQDKLKKYLIQSSGTITQLHKQHLTQFTIGFNDGEIHPHDAYKIIVERSKIVIENDINDWKFLRGICEKYTSHKKRGSIYKLIKEAINNEWIEPSSGGGTGEIKKMAEKWVTTRYINIHKYKIMAIFDSDRKAYDDLEVKEKALIAFLKRREDKDKSKIQFSDCHYEPSDLMIWHILHKRKIENYVPLSVLFNCIPTLTDQQKSNLNTLHPSELDFYEYELINIGLSKRQRKAQFPDMFLTAFSMHDLEKMCEHHRISITLQNGAIEEISEIEQILLKIAKII